MSAHVIGVDPGADGGAVLLDGAGQYVAAVGWHKLEAAKKRGGRVTWEVSGHRTAGSLFVVGEMVRHTLLVKPALTGWSLIVEQLFANRKNPNSTITLGESAALVYGHLLAPYTDAPWRVLAATWRPRILGLGPSTTADAAESIALHYAPLMPWAKGLRAEEHGAGFPHVCEAACIARWGWLYASSLEAGLRGTEPPARRKGKNRRP